MGSEGSLTAINPYFVAGSCALLFHGLLLAVGPGIRPPKLPKERASHAVTVTLAKRTAPDPEEPGRSATKKRVPVKPVVKQAPVPAKEPAPIPEPVIEPLPEPVLPDEPVNTIMETERPEMAPAEETRPDPETLPAVPSETALRAGPAQIDAAGDREATPVYRLNRPPRYPRMARKRGWEGRVFLDVEVLEDGTVSEVDIAETSGYGILDAAAEEAVRAWQFEPGTRFGRPVTMRVRVPVRFRLNNGDR